MKKPLLSAAVAFACAACLAAAVKSKRLEHAFKCRVPDEVYETLKEKLSAERKG